MLDLKSCPFCGGEATHRRFTGNGFTLARVEYTQVSCQKCRIETEPDQPLGNEDRAATAWNRRTLQAVGPEPVAVRELHGPYGWLNGHRALSEDSWELENDPLENSDEYFAIPLYALTDPFAEIGKDGPRSALVATPPAERMVEALAEFLCGEFDFDLNPVVGAHWPEHPNDDGYRGDHSFARLQPSDVQARARDNAKRIIAFLGHRAALATKPAVKDDETVVKALTDDAIRAYVKDRSIYLRESTSVPDIQNGGWKHPFSLTITGDELRQMVATLAAKDGRHG